MALTKKQKEMIRVALESEYFDNSSFPAAFVNRDETFPYSEPWMLTLFYKVKDAGIASSRSGLGHLAVAAQYGGAANFETFTEHFDREILGWQKSQGDKIRVKKRGVSIQTTIGLERVRKNREERKEIMDRLARRREKMKQKVLIF